MAGEIRVGTSGWNYPTGKGTWNGVFYPARRGRGFDELAYYAEHFDTVEVNSTFYRMPEPAHVMRWVERTPADFLFAIKLFQKFTHPDMYLARDGVTDWNLSRADVDLFRTGVEPLALAGRLGALLIQFPSSFHREPAMSDYLSWLLEVFAAYPLAVELRHRSWFGQGADTYSRLAAAHACLVIADDPETLKLPAQSPILNPPSPILHPQSSIQYFRFHGRNREAWWHHEAAEDRYNYLYSPAELSPFAEQARTVAATGRRVFAFMNNHFSAKAVANAAILKSQLGQDVPGDYPAEMIARYPDLAGVVTTSGLPL